LVTSSLFFISERFASIAAETANRHRSSNAGGYKMPQEIDFTGASPG
jgi:hypothetical protein